VLGSCNCALAYTSIAAPFAASDSPVIRVFINGFDVSSNVVQLSVSPTNLQGNKLTIKITAGSTTGLRGIWLSWLAFSPSTASFGSYGGQVSQSKYSGSVSSDISNSLYQSPYVLYGLNLLSLSASQPLAFTSSIDSDFVLTIGASSTVDDFSLVYIAVGVLPSKVCASCGTGLAANGNNCVGGCDAATYAFTYKDGGVGCRSCSSKLGLILSNGKCVQGSITTSSTTTVINAATGSSSSSTTSAQGAQTGTASSSTSSSSSSGVTANVATTPSVIAPPPSVIAPPPSVITPAPTVIAPAPAPTSCPVNAFFNGNECVCDVGFVYLKGKCQAPNLPVTVPIIIAYPDQKPCNTTTSASSSSSASASSTATSSSTAASTSTSTSTTTSTSAPASSSPAASASNSSSSSSSSTQNSSPVSGSSSSTCGPNSYNNGLGVCVCNQGSYFSNNACVVGVQCGANSQLASNGSCACNQGFTNYGGVCSQCPPGALWSSAASQCIFVCGQNSAYSATAKACACNPGYGLLGSSCQTCPNNYFISNGYCVTCPVNSVYNPATQSCSCLAGFFTNQWGICAQLCGTNQVYNSATQACSCLQGLAKVNGACQICPAGSTPLPDGSACSACKVNEVLVNGNCVCQQGYAYNSGNVCTSCTSLPNGFLVNGVCAVCPGSTVYNGNTCACPQGKVSQGSLCISQCQSDELLDSKGNCYTCGNNQIISNGQCVCAPGYTKNSCGVCSLACSANQFTFQGACATCPLNTVFNAAISGCACPSGYYMDNFGVCQKLTLQAVTCPNGQYFDSNNGCLACNSSCKTCKSATQCLTCSASGYSANPQGVCNPVCGDGLIVGSETCDTGSSSSAGCIGCQIQTGFACSGQPSVCRSTAPVTPTPTPTTPTTPPTPVVVPAAAAALVQVGTTSINSNNVFISLQTNPTFTFNNPTDMQNFMQSSFPSGPKPTVYCAQRTSPNLNIFDCLLIYPSGVPNGIFTVNFSYNYQGKSGSTSIKVNPLVASASRGVANQRLGSR
jgi:hypothetical protein